MNQSTPLFLAWTWPEYEEIILKTLFLCVIWCFLMIKFIFGKKYYRDGVSLWFKESPVIPVYPIGHSVNFGHLFESRQVSVRLWLFSLWSWRRDGSVVKRTRLGSHRGRGPGSQHHSRQLTASVTPAAGDSVTSVWPAPMGACSHAGT